MSYKIIVRVAADPNEHGSCLYEDIELDEEQIHDLAIKHAQQDHGFEFIHDVETILIIP